MRNIKAEVGDGRICGLDAQLNIIKRISNNEYLEIIRNLTTSAITETIKQIAFEENMPKKVSNGLTTRHSSVPTPTVTISEKEIIATIPQYDDFTNRTLKELLNQLELISAKNCTVVMFNKFPFLYGNQGTPSLICDPPFHNLKRFKICDKVPPIRPADLKTKEPIDIDHSNGSFQE
ncbi:hypothetical protein ACTA71_012567 [Dictyostelium dimigraforme]